jgi:uncharacterized membrane protein YgcG
MKAMEATSVPSALKGLVLQIHTSLKTEVFPAVCDLWALYELATEGRVGSCPLGTGGTAGNALFNRLNSLEAAGKDFLARLAAMEQSGVTNGGPSSGGGFSTGSSIIGLAQRVATLERQAESQPPNPIDLPSLFSQHTLDRGGNFTPGLGGVVPQAPTNDDSRLLTLEAKIGDLEAQMDNVSVSMGGFTFKSVHDCESFVLEHIPGNSYAHFYDVVSLLQRSWGQVHVGLRETLEQKNALTKAGFCSEGEAVIISSMKTVLPTCLGELTGKNSECHLPLPALGSHESWTSKGFQMGSRKDISDGITRIWTTLEGNIRDLFQGFGPGRSVVTKMLAMSRSHWSSMERMIDTFYAEFLVTSTEKDAWSLTSLIEKTVFVAIHHVRSVGADISDIVSPSKRAAKVMWSTLQAHRIMRSFIDADFRNHAMIAPVIVLHLLENRVRRTEVDGMKAKLQAQANLLIVQRRDHDKLVSQVNALKGQPGRGTGGWQGNGSEG